MASPNWSGGETGGRDVPLTRLLPIALFACLASTAARAADEGTPAPAPPIPPAAAGAAPAQCAALIGATGPERLCVSAAAYDRDVCSAIARLAATYRLPEGYLARLLWQESRFDPAAISPAGAEGIAQFMPGTARLRGLSDSFAPAEALVRSAEYLRFLADKFGNLGLAAAAYNAGEARVARWQRLGGNLAGETQAYVMIVTGVPVEQWQAGAFEAPDFTLRPGAPFLDACLDMASTRPMPDLPTLSADWKPWGVLIAQAFSPAVAMKMFERQKSKFADVIGDEAPLTLAVHNPNFGRRIRHSVQLGRDSREEAEVLCARLQKAGASCIVVRN